MRAQWGRRSHAFRTPHSRRRAHGGNVQAHVVQRQADSRDDRRGESLSSLPPSVMAVMEADRNGGSFSPLRSALLGSWELPIDHAVRGTRTLTLDIED